MPSTEAKYRISVIADMLTLHPQTIRTYEKLGFINPRRTKGNSRLFSDKDVQTIAQIQALTQEMGVNLAGVEIILRMKNQIEKMQNDARELLELIDTCFSDQKFPKTELTDIIIQRCRLLQTVELTDK